MSFTIENISKSFKDLKALDAINFSTSKGEIFGLIGPDGAGKTTLFRILTTLLLADEGRATVAGLDVKENFRDIRKIIGYMAGRFSLYQDLTVKENLEFYATVFGTTIDAHYDLIKGIYSHIEPFENRLAGKLSGGMKQKLALSCALIHHPKVLVLDEPTTGVDAVSRKEFWDMLKNIQKEGITILVSTPYMDEAALCDRVGLIQKGELLSVSHPGDLKIGDGKSVYKFSTSENNYDYLNRIRQISEKSSAWLFGDEIHTFTGNERDEKILTETIKTWNVPGLVWKKVTPTVEDYFMQLMAEKN